eukprot:7021550-Pyramimonas_sp.AAC.1
MRRRASATIPADVLAAAAQLPQQLGHPDLRRLDAGNHLLVLNRQAEASAVGREQLEPLRRARAAVPDRLLPRFDPAED